MLFINQVLAADTVAENSSYSNSMSFMPLILIFAIFYFLVIRPQQKKIREHRLMIKSLKAGNKVITIGGIIGTIKSIDDKENLVKLEIADGVVIEIVKNNITEEVRSKEDISHKKKDKSEKLKKK